MHEDGISELGECEMIEDVYRAVYLFRLMICNMFSSLQRRSQRQLVVERQLKERRRHQPLMIARNQLNKRCR